VGLSCWLQFEIWDTSRVYRKSTKNFSGRVKKMLFVAKENTRDIGFVTNNTDM
ncbi:16638_t:CDS:1, partial [Racocetra persica]